MKHISSCLVFLWLLCPVSQGFNGTAAEKDPYVWKSLADYAYHYGAAEHYAAAQSEPERLEQEFYFELNLVDGSRIVGSTEMESAPLHTAFAEIDIPLSAIMIAEIGEDSKTAVVRFRSGDRLTGAFGLESISLETIFGKVSVDIEHIRNLRVMAPDMEPQAFVTNGLIAYWTMNTNFINSTLYVIDEWGDNDGRVEGRVTFDEIYGVRGKGVSFDGVNGAVTIPAFRCIGYYEKHTTTVAFWAKAQDALPIVNHRSTSGVGMGQINITDTGALQYWIMSNASRPFFYGVTSTATSDTEAISFYVVIIDMPDARAVGWHKASITFVINDRPSETHTLNFYSSTSSPHNHNNLLFYKHINHVWGTAYYAGTLDEVRIYDRALTTSEIRMLYDLNRP